MQSTGPTVHFAEMRKILTIARMTGAVALLAGVTSCGSDGGEAGGGDRPTIAVSTSVWGDVVTDAFGDVADVEVIIPAGTDPHEFALSTRQAERMEDADLVVVNGLDLEEGMVDVVAAVARTGTPTFEMAGAVTTIDDDPHVWMDPTRVATALGALGEVVAELPGVDRAALDASLSATVDALAELDREVQSTLVPVPPERRLLVTGHDSFAYFADRYGFEVLGSVIPSTTTAAAPSAAGLEQLASVARERGVPAIFVESVHSDDLATALAGEIGDDVEVVELFTETVGDSDEGADSYAGFLLLDAQRIAAALG